MANPTKWRLGLEEAHYLGHVVRRGCIKPQTGKVESLTTWLRPTTKKQMRTFLGLVGYYRQFILSSAPARSDPEDPAQPGAVNPVAEEASQNLREALCQEPVLATPSFQLRFTMQTDASEGGIGAVVSQVQDGVEHPIAYISRRLLKHERNYAT